MLEVMDSLQNILFPLSDGDSQRLLKSLVEDQSLDPDILNFDFVSNRNQFEKEIAYVHLVDELSELHQELESPPPRGWLQEKLDKKKDPRFMMMATLSGVFFAFLIGALTLVGSGVQIWITYEAWKHPVAPMSSINSP